MCFQKAAAVPLVVAALSAAAATRMATPTGGGRSCQGCGQERGRLRI
jgi:ribosomal protein S14